MLLLLLLLVMLLCVAQCDTNPARCAAGSGQPQCQSPHAGLLYFTSGLLPSPAAGTHHFPQWHYLCSNQSLTLVTPATAAAAAAAATSTTVIRHQKSNLFGLKCQAEYSISMSVIKFPVKDQF